MVQPTPGLLVDKRFQIFQPFDVFLCISVSATAVLSELQDTHILFLIPSVFRNEERNMLIHTTFLKVLFEFFLHCRVKGIELNRSHFSQKLQGSKAFNCSPEDQCTIHVASSPPRQSNPRQVSHPCNKIYSRRQVGPPGISYRR